MFRDDRRVGTAVTRLLITRDTDLLNLTQRYDKYLSHFEDYVEKQRDSCTIKF